MTARGAPPRVSGQRSQRAEASLGLGIQYRNDAGPPSRVRMTGQSTLDESVKDTNAFYRRTLHVLSDAAVPFLVGNSGNGICTVDDDWFEHSVETRVLGMPVKIVPCEELLWQKSFVMERERFDGADLMHILRARGAERDWHRLSDRFGPRWPLLYSYLVLFTFNYPGEVARLPAEVLDDFAQRHAALRSTPPGDRVCQGTLVSRAQYLIDIGQYGYADARLVPRGGMSAEDAIVWTWAIHNMK